MGTLRDIRGGSTMRMLLGLCGLAALAALVLLLGRPGDRSAEGTAGEPVAARPGSEAPQTAPALDRAARRDSERAAPSSPAGDLKGPAEPDEREGRLHGVVLDRERRPLAAASVTYEAWAGTTAREPGQTLTDEAGRFEVRGLASRTWRVRALAGDRTSRWTTAIASPEPESLELVVDTTRRVITAQVLAADGRPAADLEVHLEHASPTTDSEGLATSRVATTDGQGLVRFALPERGAGFLCVRDHRGTAGAVDFSERDTVLRLVLGAPARLRGAVAGSDGQVTLARVVGTEHGGPQHFPFASGGVVGDGYAFAALPPGTYALSWNGARALALEHSLQLAAGDDRVCDLALVDAGSLAGHVRDEKDLPLAGATVRVRKRGGRSDPYGWMGPGAPMQRFDAQPWTNSDEPATTRVVQSGADGTFAFTGLAPGKYALTIRSPGRTSLEHLDTEVREGKVTRVGARLSPAGALQLVVDPGKHVGVFPAGGTDAVAAFVAPADGACVISDLAPGRYVVESLGLGRPRLAEASIVAGRTTWVDVRNLGTHELRGRVLAGGVPIAGARVGSHSRTTATDERGAYRLRGHQRIALEVGNLLRVHHGGASWSFRIPDDATEFDCELGSAGLEVRLVAADGTPLEGRMRITSGAFETVHFEVFARTQNGVLRVPCVPGASAFADVEFARGGRVQTQTTLPAREPLVLMAPGEGALEVLLLDVRGVPLPGVHVNATAVGEPERYGETAQRTDEHGRARIGGLPLRPHTVKVFHWMTTGEEVLHDPVPELALPRPGSGEPVTLRMR